MSICGKICRNMADTDHPMTREVQRLEQAETSGAQTLDRALMILDLLAKERILSLTEISRRLGLTVSTTHRLLKTLLRWRYVYQGPRSRHYRIGLRAFEVGSVYLEGGRISDTARQLMRSLMEQLEETVCLAILDGAQAVFIQQTEGPRQVGMYVRAGTRVPLHATAAGKVLVAWHEMDAVREMFRDALWTKHTDQTIGDFDAFCEELQVVRARGFALESEEYEGGVFSVAVPILNRYGDVGASLSVLAPTNRIFPESEDGGAIAVLLDAAKVIGLRLGWNP